MMNNGDITPKNNYEMGVYFCTIILAINIFALALSFIQDMVQGLSEDQKYISEYSLNLIIR